MEDREPFAILTAATNEIAAPIHHRMPVIPAPTAFGFWLAGAKIALEPYPPEAMTAWPVSAFVNRPANDDPRCIEPAADGQPDAWPTDMVSPIISDLDVWRGRAAHHGDKRPLMPRCVPTRSWPPATAKAAGSGFGFCRPSRSGNANVAFTIRRTENTHQGDPIAGLAHCRDDGPTPTAIP